MWNSKEIRKMIFEESKRAVRILKPENTFSVARSIARKEIANASPTINGSVDFETSDATPYVEYVLLPYEDCIGQIIFSFSAAIPDGSETCFYYGVAGFKVVAGVVTVASSGTVINYTPAGALTGSTVNLSGNSDNELELTFTGVAATDIQGRITWGYYARQLVTVIP